MSHEVLTLEDEQNTYTLQETITYPTLGSWDNHQLKHAIRCQVKEGDMLVSFREGIFFGSRRWPEGKVTVFLVACDTKRPSQNL